MCKGGAIAYVVHPDSGISEQWILHHIVPHPRDYGIDPQVCLVLGRAVLWALFDPIQRRRIPEHRRQQMLLAYQGLGDRNTLPEGENPVQRKALVVVGHDAEVVMDLVSDEIGNGSSGTSLSLTLAQRNQEVRLLSSQVLQLRHEQIDTRAETERQFAMLRRRLGRMDNNLSRLANRSFQPLRRFNAVAVGAQPTTTNTSVTDTSTSAPTAFNDEDTPMETVEDLVRTPSLIARLGNRPKTLNDLWKEYVFGASVEYKPAKDFTRSEKGKCSSTYCRRNVFWEKVSEMIRMGYSAENAIDKIYDVYGGNMTVTQILNAMMNDRGKGVTRVGLSEPLL